MEAPSKHVYHHSSLSTLGPFITHLSSIYYPSSITHLSRLLDTYLLCNRMGLSQCHMKNRHRKWQFLTCMNNPKGQGESGGKETHWTVCFWKVPFSRARNCSVWLQMSDLISLKRKVKEKTEMPRKISCRCGRMDEPTDDEDSTPLLHISVA